MNSEQMVAVGVVFATLALLTSGFAWFTAWKSEHRAFAHLTKALEIHTESKAERAEATRIRDEAQGLVLETQAMLDRHNRHIDSGTKAAQLRDAL